MTEHTEMTAAQVLRMWAKERHPDRRHSADLIEVAMRCERDTAEIARLRAVLLTIANGATGYADRDSDLAAIAREALA